MIFIFYIILGAVLLVLDYAEIVDEFWSGMGLALLIVGALRLIKTYRLSKNDEYREQFEIEVKDERN